MTPPQPTAPAGNRLQRLLGSNVPMHSLIITCVAVAVALSGIAVANYHTLAARIDETNVRIDATASTLATRLDETNVRIDALSNTLAARIDETNVRIDQTNARLDALQNAMHERFDRLTALIQGVVQDHGRRLDALERRLANTPAGPPATP